MIVATNNKGKLEELKKIFNEFQLYSLSEKGIDIDVVEDEDTFYGNALKKAKEIYELVNEPVIADDSGLCITAFNDWPGVFTHRFLGENATKTDRNNAILDKMKDLKEERDAKVVCNLVYYDGVNTIIGEGIINGKISLSRRGENGFGFDEIFEIENGKTLAELTKEEKNKISARALAAYDLKQKIKSFNIIIKSPKTLSTN